MTISNLPDPDVKILLYGLNYTPELTGIGKYSGEMGAWLSEQGHELQVITAPPYYPEWKIAAGYGGLRYIRELVQNIKVVRCPLYVPRHPTAIKRFLHLTSFALSSSFALVERLFWRPNIVILVVPTLFCALPTLLFAKLIGAKTVIHIQDYEVDTLFGLSLMECGWLSRLAFGIERRLLKGFDRVSTISEGMIKRALLKGLSKNKLIFFPNWSETVFFQDRCRDRNLLESLGVDPTKKVVLYSGNIGQKQGLESVIDVAFRFQEQGRKDVSFLIVGDGVGRAQLIERANNMGLQNVLFLPLQAKELFPKLLASVDCHLVVQKRGVADAVLPSKLTNILSVGGNAVITADRYTSMGLLCKKFPGIACLVEPESVEALERGIEKTLEMPIPNKVASNYALEHLNKEQILARFCGELESLLNNESGSIHSA